MTFTHILYGFNLLFRRERSLCVPAHLQIEPVNDCNLRCLSCPRSKLVTSPARMPLERFRGIIDAVRPRYLTLSGLGETLLHPDIGAMIVHARSRGAYVNMTSNGTLLDGSRAAALLDSGLDELSVSLDAADPETYRSIRGQDLWERLIGNLREFIATRNRRGTRAPIVRAQFVIQARNAGQIVAFTRLCKEVGVDSMYLQHLSLNGIEERREALCSGLAKDRLIATLREAKTVAAGINLLRTNLADLIRNFDRYWQQYELRENKDRTVCLNPWFDAYINVDGRLQPCCAFAGDVAGIYFGSVFSQPFREVFNGTAYRGFRRAIKRRIRPYEVCRRCHPVGFGDIVRQTLWPR